MPSPIDVLLSATRTAVRHATQYAAPECPETTILDDLMSQPFRRAGNALEPAHAPVVVRWLDVAVQAATTAARAHARGRPWPLGVAASAVDCALWWRGRG